MITRAYGATLCSPPSSLPDTDSDLSRYWSEVTQLSGRHYSIPRGSCGRRYITTLCDEILHLSRGIYPSERAIVFSSVIFSVIKQLTLFEDVEVTGTHIDFNARRIQGSAGSGGCDSSYWQDVLLRIG